MPNVSSNGYVYHPVFKINILHPSHFSDLCDAFPFTNLYVCSGCRERRTDLAARTYLCSPMSYRELQSLWAVSRSGIQRRAYALRSEDKSLLPFPPREGECEVRREIQRILDVAMGLVMLQDEANIDSSAPRN